MIKSFNGNQQPSQIGDDLEGSTTRDVPSKGSNFYEDEISTSEEMSVDTGIRYSLYCKD